MLQSEYIVSKILVKIHIVTINFAEVSTFFKYIVLIFP